MTLINQPLVSARTCRIPQAPLALCTGLHFHSDIKHPSIRTKLEGTERHDRNSQQVAQVTRNLGKYDEDHEMSTSRD